MEPTLKEWREKTESFPEIIQCESTNMCNAACVMCPVTTQMTRPKMHMAREVFEKIVSDSIGNKVHDFHLFQQGEPLLIGVQEFVDRIKYAKEKLNPQGTRVGFYTNAAVLFPKVSDMMLSEAPPDFIVFSFDGGTKEVYEKIRVGLQFESVVRNIKYFCKKKHDMGLDSKIRTEMIMVVNKINEDSIPEFRELFENCHIDNVGCGGMVNYGGSINTSGFMHKHQHEANGKGKPCWRLWTNMVIQSDGKVALCCQEHDGVLEIGDVMKNSIKEIWQGEVFTHYRKMQIQGRHAELKVCGGCDYTNFFTAPNFYFQNWDEKMSYEK